MRDLLVSFGSFADTTFTVNAVTDAGRAFLARHFGASCESATMPKSSGEAFERAMAREGVR